MTNINPQQPLVSVIIPVYNMEKYLAETISSVLVSTQQNFEIVIVDDGSTDDSQKVAMAFAEKDERIKFFIQKNSGASVARNHAIRMTSGKYILPLDADDLIGKEYIEKAAEVLEKQQNVKLVVSRSVFFGEKQGEWELPAFSLRLLARKNLMNNCSMYRKSDWEKAGGYCEEMRGREDWDFWISLLKNGGEVHKLPIVGLHYRIRQNSKRVMARKWKKEIIDKLNERHADFFKQQLGGKLRYFREASRFINFFVKS